MIGSPHGRQRPQKRGSAAAALAIVALALTPAAVLAAAGDADTSFSQDGVRRIDYSDVLDDPSGLAVDARGRIIVAGSDKFDMTLTRLRPNGQFDPGFSGDGRLRIDFGGHDRATDVARQGDTLLVAGVTEEMAALAKVTKAGALDRTFSRDGRLTFIRPSFSSTSFQAVAATKGGLVVAVGAAFDDGRLRALIARYTARGRLDRSFSGDGIRAIGSSTDIVARDVLVQADGKILLLLQGEDQGTGVLRIKANGATDRSYGGGDGIADLPSDWEVRSFARDGDRIVVVADESGPIRVVRLTANGAPSAGFGGGDGQADIDDPTIGQDEASDVAVQADSRVVIAASNGNQLVIRLTASGQLDASFNGGLGFVEVGGGDVDLMRNVRVDGQGRIVAAGKLALGVPDAEDQVVYRFLAE